MVDPGVRATLCCFLLTLAAPCQAYKISTLDTEEVCNQTIYLDDGPKSAAILTLTSKEFYDITPMHCFIHFIAPLHQWSGLTGVLEELDLRRYEDSSRHRQAQNECVDYILVEAQSEMDLPQERQCGTWSVGGQDELAHVGYHRTLVGYCPTPPASSGPNVQLCSVSQINVEVSIGERDNNYLWRNEKWRQYKGFTLVVTAYTYSYRENECADGLRSCGPSDHEGQQHKCVHQSLWCDHHINCGQPRNLDEISCFNPYVTMEGLVPVMVGPWVGAAVLLLLVLAGVVYWRRARPPAHRDPPPPQELNSYAESYEVSSTLSSAHHMAIQVRVVCNSGHGGAAGGAAHLTSSHQQQQHSRSLHRWAGPSSMDLPPSYESLFPHGPPSPRSYTIATPASNSAASLDITTTSLLSLGSSPGATSPATSNFYSNTMQTSSIVIPISAICTSHNTTIATTIPPSSAATTTTTSSSFITTPSHSTAASSTATTSPPVHKTTTVATNASYKVSGSTTTSEPPQVEFTPLVEPEDMAISPSSLCSDPCLPYAAAAIPPKTSSSQEDRLFPEDTPDPTPGSLVDPGDMAISPSSLCSDPCLPYAAATASNMTTSTQEDSQLPEDLPDPTSRSVDSSLV